MNCFNPIFKLGSARQYVTAMAMLLLPLLALATQWEKQDVAPLRQDAGISAHYTLRSIKTGAPLHGQAVSKNYRLKWSPTRRPSDADTATPTLRILSPLLDSTVGVNPLPMVVDIDGDIRTHYETLKSGLNTVILQASNECGNSAQDTVHVFLDDVPPVISNISPIPGFWVTNSFLHVTYTADAVAYNRDFILAEGLNTVVLDATDSVGNMDHDTVTYRLDSQAPTVVIVNPAQDTSVRIDSVLLRYTVDGQIQSRWVKLVSGSNKVVAQSTDSAGNIGRDTVLVRYIPGCRPDIIGIPTQVAQLGQQFRPLDLMGYVTHCAYPLDQMQFLLSNGNNVSAAMVGTKMNFTLGNAGWYGLDSVRLIVQDPDGLRDTAIIALQRKNTLTVNALVRDFKEINTIDPTNNHPDFQPNGTCSGIGDLQARIKITGADPDDRNPVQLPGNTDCFRTRFSEWYTTSQDTLINRPFQINLTFVDGGNGTIKYTNTNFFPIDKDSVFVPVGKSPKTFGHLQPSIPQHNFGFTMEFHAQFQFKRGTNQVFKFTGDDDVWVFINDSLLLDLGGIHGALTDSIKLDNLPANFLVDGQQYPLDFFSAERHTSQSNILITTSLGLSNAQSQITLDKKNYPAGTTGAQVTLVDQSNGPQIETRILEIASSNGDTLRPVATESATFPGKFTRNFTISNAPVQLNDTILQVTAPATLSARYIDPDYGDTTSFTSTYGPQNVVAITAPLENQLFNHSPVPVVWNVNGLAQTTQLSASLVQGSNRVVRSYTDETGISADTVNVSLDSIPPQIYATPSLVDGNNGWYRGLATVSFACTDDTRLVFCSGPVSVTTNGKNISVSGQARDSAGNQKNASLFIKRDAISPILTLDSAKQLPLSGGARVTLMLTAKDSISGLKSLQCSGNTVSLVVQPISYQETLPLGSQSISCLAMDSAGNTFARAFSIEVTPNRVPYAVQDNYSVNASDSMTATGLGVLTNDTDGDGDSLVALLERTSKHGVAELKLNGMLHYKPTLGFSGLDSISYRATDGKDTSVKTWVVINVIHSPLAVIITSPDADYLTRFIPITVQYSVNGLLRSKVFSLVEGANQLIVDTLDDLNQTIADTVNVIKDGIPPSVVISSPMNNATVLINPVAVQWSVDGVSQVIQTSENLLVGLNTITRQAIDAAGNTGTDSVSVEYSIATALVKIHSPADGFHTNQSPMVVCWSVNGVYQTTDTMSILHNGANKIIRSIGSGSSADTVNVYFSQTIPNVVVTAPANGTITNRNPFPVAWTINGMNQEFRTVEYLQSGSNLVRRAFTDVNGNTGVDSIHIIYDTIPPLVAITSPENGFTTRDSSLTITWTVDGAAQSTQREVHLKGCCISKTITRTALDSAGNQGSASIQVMFDGQAPIVRIVKPADGFITNQPILGVDWTVDGVMQITRLSENLKEGENTLDRIATDAVGNTGVHRIVVFLDTRPPVVKINSPVTGTVSRENTIQVVWTADGITQSIQNQATLNEGTNRIVRNKTDAADNTGSDTVIIIRDSQGPLVQILSPINGFVTRNPNLHVSWSVDGATQSTMMSQLLQEGDNEIVRTAIDGAGNTGVGSVHVLLDTHGSAVQIISPTNGFVTNNPSPSVSWTVDGIFQNNSITQALIEGPNTISREFTDFAGNRSNASITVTLDTQNPVVKIIEPVDGAVFGDSLITVKWTVDGVRQSELTSEILHDGSNTITRSYTDSAGNNGTVSLQVSRDVLAPVVKIVSPSEARITHKSTLNVSWKVDEVFQTTDTVQTLTPGVNTIVRTFSDAAGNASSDSVHVTYDAVTAPLEFTSPRNFALVTTPDIMVSMVVRENVRSVNVEGLPAVRADSVFSVLVPLKDGRNTLMAVAEATDGSKFTASVSLTLDREAPRIEITSPHDLDRFTSNSITVSGEVSDRVRSEMEANPKVTVNGIPATVRSNTFSVTIPLVSGSNSIRAVAADSAGNNTSHNISVFLDPAIGGRIAISSGQNQSGPILSNLSAPLEVELRDSTNQLVVGRPVIFRVVKGDGLLTGGKRALAINTGSNGRAFVNLTLGSRGGLSTNQVRASSADFAGDALFTSTGVAGTPSKINTVSGQRQQGLIRNHLPKPLIAVVTDTTGNPIVGLPVHFRVVQGDGTLGGNALITSNTAENGWSTAVFTLGGQTGRDSQVVEADFDGNPGLPARFTFTAFNPVLTAKTTLEGVVLDNANIPLQGATVLIEESGQQAISNAKGRFLVNNPPIGNLHLKVDGSTVKAPGDWATLEYEVTTLPGVANSLGMSIYLVPRDNANGKIPLADKDVTITIPQVPGFKLEIKAGSAQFPEDVEDRLVTATQVKFDKIPMPPGEGMQPLFIVTIGPPSVKFDPPARLTFPNVNGLAPGRQTHFFSFDHDLGTYVSIGTGTVSEDGTTVSSDPGFGIIKGGWHCGAPSNPTGSVINNTFKEDEPGLF